MKLHPKVTDEQILAGQTTAGPLAVALTRLIRWAKIDHSLVLMVAYAHIIILGIILATCLWQLLGLL